MNELDPLYIIDLNKRNSEKYLGNLTKEEKIKIKNEVSLALTISQRKFSSYMHSNYVKIREINK